MSEELVSPDILSIDEKCGTCGHELFEHENGVGACGEYMGSVLDEVQCGCPKFVGEVDWGNIDEETLKNMSEEELQQMLTFLAKRRDEKNDKDDKSKGNGKGGLKCSKCDRTGVPLIGLTVGNSIVSLSDPKRAYIECKDYSDCVKHRKPVHYSGGDWSNGAGVTWAKCRHEPTEVFSIGDVKFYGGSETKVNEFTYDDKTWLVVSLLGMPTYKQQAALWTLHPDWNTYLKPFVGANVTASVAIDWSDGQAPPVKPGFWNRIVALANRQKLTKVLFYCMGGHGRTGTALASVLIECADMDCLKAYNFVKEKYCKEAIETSAQVKYLEKLDAYYVQKAKAAAPKKGAK